MSFAVWMLAFLGVMAVLVGAAVVVGVPQGWLAIVLAVVVVLALVAGVQRTRQGPH